MGTKRKTHRFKHGDIIDVEEYHDGRYGAPGMGRQKKKKPTPEQMIVVNVMNKARKARKQLLAYFNTGDYFVTWTYRVDARPPDMETAQKHFTKAIKYIKRRYKKAGQPLRWIRNIEQGTRGAWHIHLIINRIPGTAEMIEDAWEHGGTYAVQIRKSKFYDEDFTALANYITKDERLGQRRTDGTYEKPRVKQTSYSTSRNMPLKEPHKEKLVRWKKEVKAKKGYYIAKIHEGINPATGFKYRRYTMIRLHMRI